MKSFSNELPNQDKNQMTRIEQAIESHLAQSEKDRKHMRIYFAVNVVVVIITLATLAIVLFKH